MLGAVWNNSISFHQQNCLEHHLHFHDGRKHKICQVFFLCQRIKHDEHTEHGELRTEMDIYTAGDLHMYAAHSYIDGWMLYVHALVVSAGISYICMYIFLLVYELQTMGVTFI